MWLMIGLRRCADSRTRTFGKNVGSHIQPCRTNSVMVQDRMSRRAWIVGGFPVRELLPVRVGIRVSIPGRSGRQRQRTRLPI